MMRVLALLLVGALLLVAFEAFQVEPRLRGLLSGDEAPRALAALAFSMLVGASVIAAFRGRILAALGSAMIWVGLGLVLLVGHAYRDEIRAIGERVWADLMPGRPVTIETESGEKAVEVRRSASGYFALVAEVIGASVPMLVDTGATHITLTYEAAQAAGFDMNRLRFDVPVVTANGTTRSAAVMLDRVAVGPIVRGRLRALVAQPGTLSRSLLGMNFLETLSSYEVRGSRMLLRPKG